MTVEEYIEYLDRRMGEIKEKPIHRWNVFQRAIRWI